MCELPGHILYYIKFIDKAPAKDCVFTFEKALNQPQNTNIKSESTSLFLET